MAGQPQASARGCLLSNSVPSLTLSVARKSAPARRARRAGLPGRRHRLRERQKAQPREGARGTEPPRRKARHRAAGSGREPLRRHEVARLLRDSGRHDHAQSAPRDRIGLPRPRGRPPQGRSDAALRVAHLQRLLVEPGTGPPPDADRRLATRRERPRAPEALQGQRRSRRPRIGDGLAIRPRGRDLRGRPRRLRPGRRLRVHPPERAADAHRRESAEKAAKAEKALSSRPIRARSPMGRTPGSYSNLLVSVPMPSITMLTVLPGVIAPTPTELPQAITSPTSSVMSWEIRLTSFSGGKTMSESG